MSGLFDTFNIAKRGLTVQQGNINTTSHNIANANTEGYSRQRAVTETTKPFGGMSRFDTCSSGQVGTGAEITSIQRIRDYFIDYQVRSETGTSGFYTQQNETLSKVESIFGEPSDNGIQQLTNEFFNSFQELSKTPDKTDVQAVAIKKATALSDRLNYVYTQLEQTRKDTQDTLQSNVIDVNSYLDQINELNKQIRGVSAVGQAPNDLMDKRDLLIDKLSEKFGIEVKRDSFETIDLSSTEYAKPDFDVTFVKSDPTDTGYSRLSYVESSVAGKSGSDDIVTVNYYPNGFKTADIKTFTIKVSSPDEAKKLQDNLNQCKILIGNKDGIVGTETKPTAGPPAVPAVATIDGANISTDSTGKITITDATAGTTLGDITTSSDGKTTTIVITSPPATVKINQKADGTMEVDNDNNSATPAIPMDETGYQISGSPSVKIIKRADGTIAINTQNAITEVDSSGTIDATESLTNLNKKIFQTYKYETDVNSVDDDHVKGDIAANQKVQEIIKGYMDNLDKLTAGLGYSVNAIQTGSIDGDTGTTGLSSQGLTSSPLFVTYDNVNKKNNTKDTGLTAKNIRVNANCILNCNTTSASGTGDGKRAAAIANLNVMKMNISNIPDGQDLTKLSRSEFLSDIGIDTTTTTSGFSDSSCLSLNAGTDGSTVDSYYKTIINNLAVITQEASRQQDNQESILSDLQDQKSAVSGVSLDEETTNLIQYQHAYQANAKMISTIDELLDVVINGLKK